MVNDKVGTLHTLDLFHLFFFSSFSHGDFYFSIRPPDLLLINVKYVCDPSEGVQWAPYLVFFRPDLILYLLLFTECST